MKTSTTLGVFTLSLLAVGFCTALPGCASGAKSSAESVAATKEAWATDRFVEPTNSTGTRANAARVLDQPDNQTSCVMQVGSQTACVHKKPNVDSPVVGTLTLNDAVRVVAASQFYRKTVTSNMDEFSATGDITPSWVKIVFSGGEGWVPARCLFDPMKLATNSASVSDARAAVKSGEAGKGFSGKVKRNAKAMKGAMGTPVLKDANYAAADAIIAGSTTPRVYAVSSSNPSTKAAVAPTAARVGADLAALDSAMQARVAEAALQAANPPKLEAAVGNLGSLFGALGVDDGGMTKMVAAVASLVSELSKEGVLTPEEERILGRECLAVCIADNKVLAKGDPIAQYIDWVGTRIAANSTMPYPSMGYQFVVIDDDKTINAIAIPGGVILITTGMLKFLESEDELAAILGHEIAHIEERHGLKAAEDAGAGKLPSLLAVAEMAATGSLDGFLNDALKDVPDALRGEAVKLVREQMIAMLGDVFAAVTTAMIENIQRGPSQAFETGADLRGMSLSRAAGWDPAAIQPVLNRVVVATGSYGGSSYSDSRAADCLEVVGYLPVANPANPESKIRWEALDGKLSE
ncbi:MAG: hypothetical protein EXS01_05045 [Phycisphaerales bacterium]|nr:hypothetical protein [Phycisphaerales bacterium]